MGVFVAWIFVLGGVSCLRLFDAIDSFVCGVAGGCLGFSGLWGWCNIVLWIGRLPHGCGCGYGLLSFCLDLLVVNWLA